MFPTRMHALMDIVNETRIDGVALVPGANLFYLIGLQKFLSERPYVLFLLNDRDPHLVLPDFEGPEAEAHLPVGVQLCTYNDTQGFRDTFQRVAQTLGLGTARLGVEYSTMRVLEHQAIAGASPSVTFFDADGLFAALRMCKDAAEIELLQAAARINEQAFDMVTRAVTAGKTEKEIVADYQIMALRAGSDGLAFDPIVVAGPNGAFPHARPSNRPVEAGEFVTMDCGTRLSGYCSDITRTFAVGAVCMQLRDIYAVVREANEIGRATARPGITAQDLDRTVRQVIIDAGYGAYFTHRTGHGLGLEVHEAPYIVEGNELMLKPGMVFTIEPGVYVPGRGGVRIEDNVVLTETGCESLTRLPRELITV